MATQPQAAIKQSAKEELGWLQQWLLCARAKLPSSSGNIPVFYSQYPGTTSLIQHEKAFVSSQISVRQNQTTKTPQEKQDDLEQF